MPNPQRQLFGLDVSHAPIAVNHSVGFSDPWMTSANTFDYSVHGPDCLQCAHGQDDTTGRGF